MVLSPDAPGGRANRNVVPVRWRSARPSPAGWARTVHPLPTALYGVVLLLTALAYVVLERAIVAQQGKDWMLAPALGKDRTGLFSIACYALAIPLAFVRPLLA